MLIVDFHTHVFPDAIAAEAIKKLENNSAHVKSCTDGTLSGLRASMREAGVRYSVLLPVCTSPRQFASINKFSSENNDPAGGLVFFGGIHPDCEDVEAKLEHIKSLGLRGIKLHPDFQGVFIDDERYVRIVRKCVQLGLYVSIHAGVNIGAPEVVHCPPERALRMLRAAYEGVDMAKEERPRVILAHLGGGFMLEETERHLCGAFVYLDLAFTFGWEDEAQILRIIRAHGADRVLFATDSPWAVQKESVEALKRLPLTELEQRQIFGENAAEMLGLPLEVGVMEDCVQK